MIAQDAAVGIEEAEVSIRQQATEVEIGAKIKLDIWPIDPVKGHVSQNFERPGIISDTEPFEYHHKIVRE
jgi:hypothetical protein